MINCISFVGTGFVIGVLSGLFGVGGGFLLVPLLNIVFSVPYNIAIGSSLLQMVGTSTASTLKHRGYRNIDYNIAGFILIGYLIGSQLGAKIHDKLRGADIRYYFSLVIFIVTGIVLFKFLFITGYFLIQLKLNIKFRCIRNMIFYTIDNLLL